MIAEIKQQIGFRETTAKRVTEAQFELYKLMKKRHDSGTPFIKQDMLDIYNGFVVSRSSCFRLGIEDKRTEEEIYNRASKWMNSAIARLVRVGYFGLQFKVPVCGLEMEKGVSCLT